MNEEMRRFMDGEYDDGLLDIPITCAHCGNEFEIEVEAIDRLITIALPRVRDFRGLNSKSFDGKGNFAFGIKEQIVFPEIEYDKVDEIRGMDIIVSTTAKSDKEGFELLKGFNFPFSNSLKK